MRLPADIYCKKRENKMITVSDLSFNFGTQTLFKGVDLKRRGQVYISENTLR